jgi:hypothetical protein
MELRIQQVPFNLQARKATLWLCFDGGFASQQISFGKFEKVSHTYPL